MKMQAFLSSRRVIGEQVSYPLLGSERVTRTAGAAAGMSGRVMFAACWAGMLINAFAKIATPRDLSTMPYQAKHYF
ncbi:MAG: hypothetical protein ACXWTD_08390 [Methylobacter sp.]